jgi:hypothetical protein
MILFGTSVYEFFKYCSIFSTNISVVVLLISVKIILPTHLFNTKSLAERSQNGLLEFMKCTTSTGQMSSPYDSSLIDFKTSSPSRF